VAHLSDSEYLHGPVTYLIQGKSRPVLVPGHNDGSVLIYNSDTLTLTQRFSLHSSAVTYLCFDKEVSSLFNYRNTFYLVEVKIQQLLVMI